MIILEKRLSNIGLLPIIKSLVIKFLHAREHVENGLHFIGDQEITEIFAAAFWR